MISNVLRCRRKKSDSLKGLAGVIDLVLDACYVYHTAVQT